MDSELSLAVFHYERNCATCTATTCLATAPNVNNIMRAYLRDPQTLHTSHHYGIEGFK